MNANSRILSDLGQAALEYAARDWHVFPIKPGHKGEEVPDPSHPEGKRKTHLLEHGHLGASNDMAQIREWWMRWPNANIGLYLAASGLVAVDVDSYKPECRWATFSEGLDVPETLRQRSARGGAHYIFRAAMDEQFEGGLKGCPGVEIKHKGYILLEPSTFEGRTYQWQTDDEPAPAPVWVPRKTVRPTTAADHGPETPEDRAKVLAALGRARNTLARGDWVRLCLGLKANLGEAARTAWVAFSERYEGDQRPGEAERVWDTADPDGSVRLGTVLHLLRGPADGVVEKAAESAPSWLADCILDSRHKQIPNLANTMLALRKDPALHDGVAFDQMASLPMLTREMPKAGAPGKACAPRPVTDQDVGALQEYLQHLGLSRVPRETVFQAMDMRAHERAYHPVRDYLSALHWDGQKRLDAWLTYYLGAEATPYTRGVGAMFLISMVARVMIPGCKVDHLPVLEGKQGAKKSTACAILGGPWFSDAMPDITQGKEASAHLNGKWLIEVGEMHAMNRAEATLLKSFITRRTERYRPAYGRMEVVQDRQCVFIATTNESVYLRDASGGRRFWPVKVGEIDTDALAADRDQLFAEAVFAFQARRPWWPDADFEREQIAPQQADRYEADAWEQAIADYFLDHQQATVTEIAHGALRIETAKISRAEQNRITAVLESLGMVRLPQHWTGKRYWAKP